MKILLVDIERNGDIYGSRGALLKHTLHNGYLKVRLKSGWATVHRLLAVKYIPNPGNLETVNHKDGNKLNNNLDNLEWCSRRDNLLHAARSGLTAWGMTPVKTCKGEVFESQAEAAKVLGGKQGNIKRAINTGGNYLSRAWGYV